MSPYNLSDQLSTFCWRRALLNSSFFMCPPSEFYRWGCGRCRIEKEKSQLKAESDDLRAQIDHIGKTKVENITSLTVLRVKHVLCQSSIIANVQRAYMIIFLMKCNSHKHKSNRLGAITVCFTTTVLVFAVSINRWRFRSRLQRSDAAKRS